MPTLAETLDSDSLRRELNALVAKHELKAKEIERYLASKNYGDLADNMIRECFSEQAQREAVAIIDERVLTQLPLPLEVTRADIADGVTWLFRQSDEVDSRFDRFVRCVVDASEVVRRSHPFSLGCGFYTRCELESGEFESTRVVWRGENDASVTLVGTIPLNSEHSLSDLEMAPVPVESRRELFASVACRCSVRALQELAQSVQAAMKAALSMQEEFLFFSKSPIRSASTATITLDVWARTVCRPLRSFLDAFFSRSTKKDSLDRRLRNAVHLLVQANNSTDPAVSMSLTVAAIEAILCKRGGDLSTQMAENVATLLEPLARYRNEAVKCVKRLYDLRSQTLHGTLLEEDTECSAQSRLLAWAVFNAFIERREFQRRLGVNSETPDDILGELRTLRFGDGIVPGVPRSDIRRLWGAPETNDGDNQCAT
jgi:hypothetical protein